MIALPWRGCRSGLASVSGALRDLRGVAGRRPAAVRFRHPDGHPALYGGTFPDADVPCGNVRELREPANMLVVLIDPGPGCDVGNAVVVANVATVCQLPLQHAVEPLHFLAVAMDRIGIVAFVAIGDVRDTDEPAEL